MPQRADFFDCGQVLGQLESWVDGDLDGATETALQRHLEECSECRREAGLARAVRQALRDMPEHEMPQHVVDAVLAETRDTGEVVRDARLLGRTGARRLQMVLAAAAAALLIVILSPRWRTPSPAPDLEAQRVAAETRLALAYLGASVQRAERQVAARLTEGGAVETTKESISKSIGLVRRVVGDSARTEN